MKGPIIHLRTAWRRWLYNLAGRRPCRLINLGGQPYLERYHMASVLGCRIYLHRFVRADAERHVHNHPWRWAASLVIAGQYIEEVATWDDPETGYASYLRQVTLFNWITPTTRHRIRDVEPETWTLFITGQRFKGWGFYETKPAPHRASMPLGHSVIFQPYPPTDHDWHRTAPRGKQAGRQPMKGA